MAHIATCTSDSDTKYLKRITQMHLHDQKSDINYFKKKDCIKEDQRDKKSDVSQLKKICKLSVYIHVHNIMNADYYNTVH